MFTAAGVTPDVRESLAHQDAAALTAGTVMLALALALVFALIGDALAATVRSRCLVNDPHLFFIHTATVHLDFRERSVDLPKIRRRQLNIDCS